MHCSGLLKRELDEAQLHRELHKLMCMQYLLGPIAWLVYDKRNNNRYEAVSTAGIATSSIDLKRGGERERLHETTLLVADDGQNGQNGRYGQCGARYGKRCQLYTKVGGKNYSTHSEWGTFGTMG